MDATRLVLIDVDGRDHRVPLRGRHVDAESLAGATGWQLKAVGLCRGEVCVPLHGQDLAPDGDPGAVDLARWAAALDLLLVHDEPAGVAALAPSAATRDRELEGRLAPELRLPDVDGNPLDLADLSGYKRVLVAWASWCGCRHELAGWQRLQDELWGAGLRVFSVALDADAEHARPWIEAAAPTYPVAVDTAHVTAERFAITNVPSVVWIDEHDVVVKPPTIAPGDDQFVEFTRIAAERHHELLRAWVRDGTLPEGRAAATPRRTDEEQRALAERRVAAYLQGVGRVDAARAHLASAQALAPWDWTVRRGGIALTGGDPFLGEEFTTFWDQWDAAGRPGYTPTG